MQERYRWADDPVECEKVFHRIACNMYAAAMTLARRACRKKHGNNYQNWKEMRPDWLENQEAWNSMCDQWENPSWQQVSEQNAINRKAPGNLVNHVAGTRSAFRHAKKLKQANGVEPSYEDVFRVTHVKKLTGEFCDARSKEVLENFIFYKANPESSEEGDLQRWIRAVGGASHGRVYGVGGLIDVLNVVQNKRKRCDPASSRPPPTPTLRVYSQEEVDALIREERRRNFELISNIYNHIGLEMPSFARVSSAASVESAQEGVGVNGLADEEVDLR